MSRRGGHELWAGRLVLVILAAALAGCADPAAEGMADGGGSYPADDLALAPDEASPEASYGFARLPAPGDCGYAHPTPGCSNPGCQACVCSSLFMCCQTEWSQDCANQTAPGMPCFDACQAGCSPNCTGKQCGDNGCGGSCGSCNDSNACSTDSCNASGKCSWVWKNCNDNNACTADSCNSTSGLCINTAKNCDDEDPCTNDSCDSGTGQCLNPDKNCSDQDPCTNDSCMPFDGECLHFPAFEDDGDPCTVDGCDDGVLTHLPLECPKDHFCVGGECALLPCLPRTGVIILAGPPYSGFGMAGWNSDGKGPEAARTGHAVPWTTPPMVSYYWGSSRDYIEPGAKGAAQAAAIIDGFPTFTQGARVQQYPRHQAHRPPQAPVAGRRPRGAGLVVRSGHQGRDPALPGRRLRAASLGPSDGRSKRGDDGRDCRLRRPRQSLG